MHVLTILPFFIYSRVSNQIRYEKVSLEQGVANLYVGQYFSFKCIVIPRWHTHTCQIKYLCSKCNTFQSSIYHNALSFSLCWLPLCYYMFEYQIKALPFFNTFALFSGRFAREKKHQHIIHSGICACGKPISHFYCPPCHSATSNLPYIFLLRRKTRRHHII